MFPESSWKGAGVNRDLRVYRAATLDDALEQAYQELGAHATILHTRQIEHRSWLPLGRTRTEVEITATSHAAPESKTSSSTPAKAKPPEVRPSQRAVDRSLADPPPLLGVGPQAARVLEAELRKHAGSQLANSPAPADHPQGIVSSSAGIKGGGDSRIRAGSQKERPGTVLPEVRATSQKSAASPPRRDPLPTRVTAPANSAAMNPAPRGLGRWQPRQNNVHSPIKRVHDDIHTSLPGSGEVNVTRDELVPPAAPPRVSFETRSSIESAAPLPEKPVSVLPAYEPSGLSLSGARIEKPAVLTTGDTPSDSQWWQIDQKLKATQKSLEEFKVTSMDGSRDALETTSTSLHQLMEETGLPESMARKLLKKLACLATPRELADAQASKALLISLIEQELNLSRPLPIAPGSPQVVALVGPTGVGKTTTLAKLAAQARLREHRKVGLITVDTFRIAAVEQLKTYAEIMELPMRVVSSPAEMRSAIEDYASMDLVLIDTSGRSPYDELKNQELKAILAEAHAHEIHLCISMASDPRAVTTIASKFIPMGANQLILTKLDEIQDFGSMLTANLNSTLPLSYLTTGQEVPDHLERAMPTRIARLILSAEPLRPSILATNSVTTTNLVPTYSPTL